MNPLTNNYKHWKVYFTIISRSDGPFSVNSFLFSVNSFLTKCLLPKIPLSCNNCEFIPTVSMFLWCEIPHWVWYISKAHQLLLSQVVRLRLAGLVRIMTMSLLLHLVLVS